MALASLVVFFQNLLPAYSVRFLGPIPFLGHVINDHPSTSAYRPVPAATVHRPWRLLFVGRPRYQQGVELLLQALALLPADLSVHLDVIGIESQHLPSALSHRLSVRMHGYLSKAEPAAPAVLRLAQSGRFVDQRLQSLAGFSATVEAMYHRTAVLTPTPSSRRFSGHTCFRRLPSCLDPRCRCGCNRQPTPRPITSLPAAGGGL